MFANRLSWTYDFRGPSKAVDTGELTAVIALLKSATSADQIHHLPQHEFCYMMETSTHPCPDVWLGWHSCDRYSLATGIERLLFNAACSSSALALHDAIADLTAGRCDYAMVGGASSILRVSTSVAFNKLHMLSPDGACKSFSAAANGCAKPCLGLPHTFHSHHCPIKESFVSDV